MLRIAALATAASLFAIVTDEGRADEDRGAQLAALCASCHRLDGGDTGMPPIIGLSEDKLARALLGYRSSEGPGHIMRAIALSLTDQEIASVAHFLAARGKKLAPP
jgi:cytochrome c553